MAQKKKNKRRRRQFQQKVILSVLLVIIIGLIGVLGYQMQKNEKKQTVVFPNNPCIPSILFGFVILSCWGQFRADIGFQPGGGDYTDA